MSNYEKSFTAAGFTVVQRIALEKAPQNQRERADALVKALQIAPEQVLKAMSLQIKIGDRIEPVIALLASAERLDLKLFSRLLNQTVDYYPQEKIDEVFGSPMAALSVLAAPEKKISVIADGSAFEYETVAISSGDPQVELLVNGSDLRAFLGGDAVRTFDLESARKGGGNVIEPRTLKGFRDYLPDEMLPRQAMIASCVSVFERFGFVPLQTPALEYTDILLGKLGADAEKLLFRFKDNGGRDVCMRYDLTVPLARVIAQYADLAKPFKRYQIAPVWRAEKPGRGRFREFFQCDCDIVGSPSLIYDAECISLGFAAMRALNVNAEIRFNSRKMLSALGTKLNVSDARQMMTIFRTIDKIPSQGKERVQELLKVDANCNAEQIGTIMRFVDIAGSNEEMLSKVSEIIGAPAEAAVNDLRSVMGYVAELTSGQSVALKLDFSIARGLDYYTGTVYETFLTDLPGYGSVMSGGRYDGLIERYLGKPVPAVGISVGLDRLLAGLIELKRIAKTTVTSRVAVVAMDAACVNAALRVLGRFRAEGIAAEILLGSEQKPKLDKQLSLAGKKGIPYAAILGGNEVARGTVMLKDLAARQQEELSVEKAIEKLK
jgi:histidyl-tRNA synthetase